MMNDQGWDDYELLAAEEYLEKSHIKRATLKVRKRKWREIDNIKENYRLQRELESFDFHP
jgi:hypothetical protein